MSASNCLAKLLTEEIRKQVFGDKEGPSAKLLAELDAHIQGIKKEYPHDFQRRMNKFYAELRLKQDNDILDKAFTAQAVARGTNRVKGVGFKGKEFKAIESFFDSPSGVLAGGMDVNVRGYTAFFLGEWETTFLGQLQQKKLLELVETATPEFDLEVKKAKWNLVEGSDIYKGISDEAKEVAQIHWDLTKKMLNDQREQGIALGNYKNYVHPQVPSSEKFLAAGKNAEEIAIKFYEFLRDPKVRFDREAAFGPKNVGNTVEELKIVRDYVSRVLKEEMGDGAPVPSKDIGDVIYAVPEGADLQKTLEAGRRFRFLDPESQHAFDTQWGKGNLFENTLSMISGKAKTLSLVKMFGSRPKEGFLKIVDQAYTYLEKTNPAEAAKLKVGGNYTKQVRNLIDNALGLDSVAVNKRLAKATEAVSNLVDSAKLGAVGFSSIPTLGLGASIIRDRTGRGLLGSTFSLMQGYLSKLTPGARDAALRRMGQVSQAFSNHIVRQMSEGFVENGLRRMNKLQSTVSGLNMINNAAKSTVSEFIAMDVAEGLSGSFEKMHPRIKATLMRAGFQLEDINLLKGAIEDVEGTPMLTKTGIAELKGKPGVAERARAKGMTQEAYITDLQASYVSMLKVGADLASSTGGPLEAISWMFGHGGTEAGTPIGSFARLRSKYSSFLGAVWRHVSQSGFSAPDLKLLEAGELRSQGFQYWAPFATIVLLAQLGFVSNAVKDMLNGKNPKRPDDPEAWTQALIQGGGGGIYAQYLLTEFDKYGKGKGTATAALGPVFGEVAPLYDTLKSAVLNGKELKPSEARQVTRFVRGNLPLQNLIGWKHFVDYMHYDIIDEYLDPGSSYRRESRLREEDANRLDFPFGG